MEKKIEKQNATLRKLEQSLRSGHHATVYEVRRDPELQNKDVLRDKNQKVFPFVGGSQYRGQWNRDKKEGFGIQVNPNGTKYEGEWAENKYHGRGTLWQKDGKAYSRQYVGDWANGYMHGQGIYYYENGDIYRGNWVQSRKGGNGRLDYKNGDFYIGDWLNDLQDGFGTMNYSNGNMYEGLWSKGKKEGPGLFYYGSTKKVYQGEWYEDQPQCGEFRSPTPEEELRFVRPLGKGIFHNDFKLPELALADPTGVIDVAVSEVRMNSLTKTFSRLNTPYSPINPVNLESAKNLFNMLLSEGNETLSIFNLREVFTELGLNLTQEDINDIISQLEMVSQEITFTEVVEIATFVHTEKGSL